MHMVYAILFYGKLGSKNAQKFVCQAREKLLSLSPPFSWLHCNQLNGGLKQCFLNSLIKDIDRNGYEGLAKPEPLKYELQGFWSVCIDKKNRIVFRITDGCFLEIYQCGSHYRDK